MRRALASAFLAALAAAPAAAEALPPVPAPAENPITEEKRILGKILFWDEQLSSDNTVACGTCHRPAAGGADPRRMRNVGADGVLGTRDDVFGSPGIARLDAEGAPAPHPVFGAGPQVGERAAPSNFGGLWADTQFWDGRAGPALVDPLTGETVIAQGGALEAQALEPIVNDVEMARAERAWAQVTGALERATPLALADELPPDVADALVSGPSYPDLFAVAFGDPAITPVRIAFALASYQRTLVADQTPWDRMEAGEGELSSDATIGFYWFRQQRCVLCHVPPLFTNNDFFNIGLRPAADDEGRRDVTGEDDRAGDMKAPSLRNVGLRPSFMHTGEMTTLDEVLNLYNAPRAQRDSLPGGGEYILGQGATGGPFIAAFLREALTDPRAANEEFPFDRPKLRSERAQDDARPPRAPRALAAQRTAGGAVRLTWRAARDDTGVVDYVVRRDAAVIGFATTLEFVDKAPDAADARYAVSARDAPGNESPPATTQASPS